MLTHVGLSHPDAAQGRGEIYPMVKVVLDAHNLIRNEAPGASPRFLEPPGHPRPGGRVSDTPPNKIQLVTQLN